MKINIKFDLTKRLVTKIVLAVLLAAFLGGGTFAVIKYQQQLARQLTALFQPNNSSDVAEEIARLEKEIEELKKQRSQTTYKTILTPASPSPAPDLKTQGELEKARQQINSLEQQLKELQKSEITTVVSDADLIKSWQATEKVVQIACQNKTTGNWQLGSGVLISEDGKILTNQHVVKPTLGILLPDYCLALFSKDYEVSTQGYKREYRATLVGFFEDRDAALLKIQDVVYQDPNGQIQNAPIINSFQFFRVASAVPRIGDQVYVIGFPESASFSFSVTKGIISNLTSDNLYFGTDAQIDRGNSGGAALNSAGELIGLPTYKFTSSGDYRGYILDIHSINLSL